MKSQANIVVVGGGVLGTSIAYHLAKAGAGDVVLLEKAALTHGSTWHAAGMVGQLRSSKNVSSMLKRSTEIYTGLEAETGQATGWRATGSLRLASNEERLREIRRSKTMADSFGLEAEILTANEARDLFPIMDTNGVLGALYVPADGVADPTGLTQSFAIGARNYGATIEQGISVTGFKKSGRRITAVETAKGTIECNTVVNAGGVWARELGKKMGVNLACCGVEHQYLITDNLDDVNANMPSMRDPDLSIYYKPEANGLIVGAWEPNTVPFDRDKIPENFGQELLPSEMDRLEPFLNAAITRTPILGSLGIRDVVNGPIPFSADGDFVLGPIADLENGFVASGCVVGIAAGGGIGEVMADWILNGSPQKDLWSLDARRFGPVHTTEDYLYPRAIEIYGEHYKLQPPGHEKSSARSIRCSPLYTTLKSHGAEYGSKFGWERPNYFCGPDTPDSAKYPSYFKPGWFGIVGDEHYQIRSNVAVIDLTSFAKFEISGPSALEALQYLSVRNLDVPVGETVYTQLCNKFGGIEADVTIGRTASDRFYYVTGTGNGVRDVDFIRRNSPASLDFRITDVTSEYAVLLLTGPKSKEVMVNLIGAEQAEGAMTFGNLSSLTIGSAEVRAMRVNFTGEMGWELHIPSEYAQHIYENVMQAGAELGIRNCGYKTLDSLRIEKGFRYWGSDITPDYNPFEAGLGFCVNLDKGDFLAKQALQRVYLEGPSQKLLTLTVESDVQLVGGEAVVCDGKIVSTTTSGAFGYSVGKAVCFAYLPVELSQDSEFEIEAFGERYPAILETKRDLIK